MMLLWDHPPLPFGQQLNRRVLGLIELDHLVPTERPLNDEGLELAGVGNSLEMKDLAWGCGQQISTWLAGRSGAGGSAALLAPHWRS